MEIPDVKYARSGDVAIAYQVVGSGPLDLVFVRGTLADLLAAWEQPLFVDHVEGLARSGRVLLFDKRGSGLSDPVRQVPTLETRMDDIRAVMDAAGSERAVLVGRPRRLPDRAPLCGHVSRADERSRPLRPDRSRPVGPGLPVGGR